MESSYAWQRLQMRPTCEWFRNLCRLIVRGNPSGTVDEAHTMWIVMSNEEKYRLVENYNQDDDVRRTIDGVAGMREQVQVYVNALRPAMASDYWADPPRLTFQDLCEAIQEKRAQLPASEGEIAEMIERGRNMWDGMDPIGKQYIATCYALHAGVRRTIQLVPELHERFVTFVSPVAVVPSTPQLLWSLCWEFSGRSGTPALTQTKEYELRTDACAIWHELSDSQKAEVSRDYVDFDSQRNIMQAIPALFALYRQHVPTLWQQLDRWRRDYVLRRYVKFAYVRRSTRESGMAEFIEAHRDLVELEAFVRYELAVRAYDAAYWDRFWQ